MPQIQGTFMHGGQNLPPDSGDIYAQGAESSPSFRACFSGVGMVCLRFKPSVKVYEIEQKPQLLVGSGGDISYVPAIPGQPDDEKHLA